MSLMKAVVYSEYGPPEVLHLDQVEKPSPKSNEVLIKIHATAVTSADWRLRKPDPFAARFFFGLTKPRLKILGGSLAGKIEAVGKDVTRFKVGDRVFGSTGLGMGSYAEFKCLPENGFLAKIPANVSFEEAAAIPFGGMTALFFLRKAEIKRGKKILIYGASGAVGTAAVQIARTLGAEVTGVCSTANLDMVKALGAAKVIDYTKQDFSKNGEVYDCVMDTVGKMPIESAKRALKEKGCLILSGAGLSQMMSGLWTSMSSGRKFLAGVVAESTEQVTFLGDLMESGRLKAVIDKVYSLERLAEAHAYVEAGHKKGNVIVMVN